MIGSYGKVQTNGVKWVANIFSGPVTVQEKIDGSQLSFAVLNGELVFRSRNQQMQCYAYEGMFKAGIEAISEIKDLLMPNMIYRGEYLSKPKHNALAYERVPIRHVILFDIEDAERPGTYLSYIEVQEEAERLGIECVPTYFSGKVSGAKELLHHLEATSILGGPFIEGIVIKNYELPDIHGGFMKAKIVREDFKEVHAGAWKKANPSSADIVTSIVESYRTEARWNKSIQHLRDIGELLEAPEDIGPLLKEINEDILEEEEDNIKDILFNHYWKEISRGITKGFAEHYKLQLMGVEDEI